MKRGVLFLIIVLMSCPIFGQFLSPYYSTLESNRGKGNQKLFYRLYSTSTSAVFPNSASEFDSFFSNYATFQTASEIKLNSSRGTLNSNTQKSANVLNFNGQEELKTAINKTTPYAGFGGDYFTIVISGYFIPKQTGTYKFSIEGDDACDVYINGNVVASHYGGHGADAIGTHTGTINLTAGKKYQFRARMMENAGGEVMFLFWQKPSETGGSVWYQDMEELSSEEVLPSGLVLNIDPSNFYSFPRGGSTTFDLKGNANGTIYNNTSFNSTNGGIWYFDGDQDYIDFGKAPANFPVNDISIFLWLKPTSLRNGWNIFLSKWFQDTAGTGGYSDLHYDIYPNGTSFNQHLFTNLTDGFNVFGSIPLSVDTWYQVGFTLKNGNLQMYLNSSLDGPVRPNAGRTNNTQSSLWLGDARSGGSLGYNGYMGSVQIYNRALTNEEVIQNFNITKLRYGY